MSIPESVIEAAASAYDSLPMTVGHPAKDRARLVILALAENMPESAGEKACAKLYGRTKFTELDIERMCAAIAAFLKHVAGETP